VIKYAGKNEKFHLIRFTAVPPEIDAYFQSHRQHSAKLYSGTNLF